MALTTISDQGDSAFYSTVTDVIDANFALCLLKAGGTMSGNIAMGDKSITGIDTLTFTDTAGTIAGIANGNLVDKSATEAITGAWTFNGHGVLEGDATAGRVFRGIRLKIEDGTNATTIKCTVTNIWNGDTIAVTDNIVKNDTTGNFTLNAGGTVLNIEAAGLTGNCVYAIGHPHSNNCGTALLVTTYSSANDIVVVAWDTSGGNLQDLTTLADSGTIEVNILYITSA